MLLWGGVFVLFCAENVNALLRTPRKRALVFCLRFFRLFYESDFLIVCIGIIKRRVINFACFFIRQNKGCFIAYAIIRRDFIGIALLACRDCTFVVTNVSAVEHVFHARSIFGNHVEQGIDFYTQERFRTVGIDVCALFGLSALPKP